MRAKKQDSDDKMNKSIEELKTMLVAITDQINIFRYSPTQKDSPKPPGPTTVVPTKMRAPPLDGGYSMKIGGMWTLEHGIISPRFYELLINT